jgi:hypothetical protein
MKLTFPEAQSSSASVRLCVPDFIAGFVRTSLIVLLFFGSVADTTIIAACPLPGGDSGEPGHVTIPLFSASATQVGLHKIILPS